MTRTEWIEAFAAEFSKGTVRGTESDAEYEVWLCDEAIAQLEVAGLDSDPAEEAREALYSIHALS